MARIPEKGVESARAELPHLLDEAARGRSTLITRHGRVVAAIVPPGAALPRQPSLTSLEGTGRGLWGSDSRRTLRRMRDEWDR
jgi:antitoxin (DNA-binding transcriptional repressor) of toxin-antitoxin stability system